MEFIYRQLKKSDMEQLNKLIDNIEGNLPVKEWWIPIDDIAREHFFDEEWTYWIGAFSGETLAGACGLFMNEHEFSEEIMNMGIDSTKTNVAEIGRCMVNPDFRGNNLMCEINSRLKEVAKSKGIETIIAVAHPDNIYSNNSFAKLGASLVCEAVVYNKYPRKLYTIPY